MKRNKKKMKSATSPVKSWAEKIRNADAGNEAMSLLWAKCIGDEAEKALETHTSPSSASSVSIRCRRHKKRFTVPVSWLETCEWLCPKCYEKLSPAERERYAPRKQPQKDEKRGEGHGNSVCSKSLNIKGEGKESSAEAATERETIAQNSKRFDGCVKPPNVVRENETAEVATEDKVNRVVQEEARKGKEQEGNDRNKKLQEEDKSLTGEGKVKKICNRDSVPYVGFSESFASLMPRFRIKCKKCLKVVPCHKSWFANSMVLCPECFSGMTDVEISTFHSSHPKASAEVFEVDPVVPWKPQNTMHKTAPRVDAVPLHSPERWSSAGGTCSNEFIMRASKQELLQAVHEGKVSKARAKIELSRRRNVSYYNDLPDANINIVSLELF